MADTTGKGAVLRLIDTATNTVAASTVAVPFPDGELRATTTAVFYGDPDKGQFRLRPGESALSRIGDPDVTAFPTGILGGDGIWATVAGQPYALYTSDGGPDGTIDLDDADGGTLVGADKESVYLERSAAEGGRELWRRYVDGRVPVRLAAAGSAETGYGPIDLVYFDPTTLLVGEIIRSQALGPHLAHRAD